ncbi:MAG: glycosyltransferase WbuB [Pseudonocardiales bacterium]|nr:glycosyltransferase WbuB [Pseudonocardiales bacterium]
MRVNLHDFSGHPFQAQLARNLAARGHDVLHGYSSQYITGHGRLEVGAQDPATLRMEGLTAGAPMVKYSPIGRSRFELAYADAWRQQLEAEAFDVVVACNVPLFALARMRRYFTRRKLPWVLWHQDVYSLGVAGEAERKLPRRLAATVRDRVERIERAQVESASAVVAIGEPFRAQYARWGVRCDHVQVIPNWAPLDELTPGRRANAWAAGQQLPTEPVRIMYAGTLGRKHNPMLLLDLLDATRARGLNAMLVVVSEGVGADDLAAASAGRADVRVIGYQPADVLSDVLASADVMIALLEPDAAQFSVPSKVLSYLSVGRPTIALVPDGNPCAADVRASGGCVAAPTLAGATEAARWLAEISAEPEALRALGERARALAVERFDIERIGSQFEEILAEAAGHARVRGGAPVLAAAGGSEGGMR